MHAYSYRGMGPSLGPLSPLFPFPVLEFLSHRFRCGLVLRFGGEVWHPDGILCIVEEFFRWTSLLEQPVLGQFVEPFLFAPIAARENCVTLWVVLREPICPVHPNRNVDPVQLEGGRGPVDLLTATRT